MNTFLRLHSKLAAMKHVSQHDQQIVTDMLTRAKLIIASLEFIQTDEKELDSFNGFSQHLLDGIKCLAEDDFIQLYIKLEKILEEEQKNNEGMFYKFSDLTARYQIDDIQNEWYLDVDYVGADGKNLLTIALETSKNKVVRFLLERRADPNYLLPSGDTPFLKAVAAGNLEGVTELFETGQVDLSSVNSKGQHCSTVAVIEEKYDLIRYFTARTDIPVEQVDNDGLSTLAHATRADDVDAVIALLKLGGVNYDEKCWEHLTANDSIKAFRYLVENKILDIHQFSHRSILYWAVKNSALKILKELHAKSEVNFGALDDFDNTILHHSCSSSLEVFRFCLSQNILFSQENTENDTVYDQLVGEIYNYYVSKTPNHKGMQVVKEYNPNFFTDPRICVPDPNLPSDTLMLLAGNYIALDKDFYDLLQKLICLYLSETDQNRLSYSDDTKARLIPLRHYISAALIRMLEGDPLPAERIRLYQMAFDHMELKIPKPFTLGLVLNYLEHLPKSLATSITYDETHRKLNQILASFSRISSKVDVKVQSTKVSDSKRDGAVDLWDIKNWL